MTQHLTIVFGITHVELATADLPQALQLYGGVLGFVETARGDGWVDLDACGTVTLRLLQIDRTEHRAALRVRVADVQATVDALVAGGCAPVYPVERTTEVTLAATVQTPDGHAITLWRALTEDEYEVVPELPKAMVWNDDADALLKQLLKGVPALFRALARRKVVRVVEELAALRRCVTREDVIRGFILSSPRITRGRNRKPLLDAGIDITRYQPDWDAP